MNDEGGDVNIAHDHDHSSSESPTDTIPNVAKRLRSRNQPWALVVDENYGEGSAREHAALQPRFYGSYLRLAYSSLILTNLIGCGLIVARSFARIHETNLKVSPSCRWLSLSIEFIYLSITETRRTSLVVFPEQRLLPHWIRRCSWDDWAGERPERRFKCYHSFESHKTGWRDIRNPDKTHHVQRPAKVAACWICT